jgi:hypothetical protein
MPNPDKCPFCGSFKTVPGQIISSEGAHGFKPDETQAPVFTFRSVFAFNLAKAATFCAACYMVWCKADSRDAHTFIQKFGTESLKKRLLTADHPPPGSPV